MATFSDTFYFVPDSFTIRSFYRIRVFFPVVVARQVCPKCPVEEVEVVVAWEE